MLLHWLSFDGWGERVVRNFYLRMLGVGFCVFMCHLSPTVPFSATLNTKPSVLLMDSENPYLGSGCSLGKEVFKN